MSKIIKQMEIETLRKNFDGVRDLVMLNVVGLDAISDNQLRLSLRKKGIRMQVVKNTLARRVFGDMGFDVKSSWDGATTVVWGGTSIAGLSKEVDAFAKKHEKFIKVKTAIADGEELTFAAALKRPTREEAIGQILALALGAGSRLVAAIVGPGSQLASQLKTITERKEEEAPAASAAAPAPAAPVEAPAPAAS